MHDVHAVVLHSRSTCHSVAQRGLIPAASELSGLIVPLRPPDSAGSVLPVSRAAGRARFLTPPASVINPGHGGGGGGSGLPGECVFLPSHIRGMSA